MESGCGEIIFSRKNEATRGLTSPMKLGRLVAFLKQSDFLINIYIHGRKIMTYRKQKKLQTELLAYKYLCLFVLGFALGYWCGKAIGI